MNNFFLNLFMHLYTFFLDIIPCYEEVDVSIIQSYLQYMVLA